jgi:mono/diheme cytochrome c family protein
MPFSPRLAPRAGTIAALLLLLPAAAAGASEAQRLYQLNCAACHGEHGDGKSRAQFGLNPPPRDFTTAAAWRELSRERMILSVTNGRPGTAMVAWSGSLGEGEIAAIVDYIRASFMRPPAQPQQTSGELLYKRDCVVCHGERGNGATWARNSLNPPPRDFTAPAIRRELTREHMLHAVANGRPGTAMMSFSGQMSPQEIDAVVEYVRASFMAAGPAEAGAAPASPAALPAADMSAPLPRGLRGDAARGRELYLRNCFVCHGEQGDGEGPRSYFIKPPPRNFQAPESRRALNRPALFQAISAGKRGTVMPAWSSVLNDAQIADVAEFVFTAFVSPAEGPGAGAGQKKKTVN